MKELSLVEHLEELRYRIVRVLLIVVISFFVCYSFGEHITQFLLVPLRENMTGDQGKIIYVNVLDKVLSQFQLSFWTSIILSSPLWFYQVWKFVAEGLYDKEKKIIGPFIVLSFFFFTAGVLFGYYIAFPVVIETLMNFGASEIEAYISMKDYLVLSAKTLFFLGLIFQLPNLLVILGFLEVVTYYSLKNARRYVLVGIAIIAAAVTPPDVVTMMFVMVPIYLLYEIGTFANLLIVHPYLKRKYMPSKN